MLISNKKIITLLSISVIITAVLSCDNPKVSSPKQPKKLKVYSPQVNVTPKEVNIKPNVPLVLKQPKKPNVPLVLKQPKKPSVLRSVSPDHLMISEGIKEIKEGAYRGATHKSVSIPDSVTTIGKEAFRSAKLAAVSIPDSVTIIGESAFRGARLAKVIIPDSVETLGKEAFFENELTSVIIGNSVTTIGKSSFGRNRLTSVTIPNSVEEIEIYAFAQNQKLTKVIISKKLYDKYDAKELGKRFGLLNSDNSAVVSNEKVQYYLLTDPTKEHASKL